jgi:TetR/AcrR family transcriptional regulator, acrAB operon repressor
MRRTKEDAARTRAAIVDGALACFDRYGITSSTMEQIACEAGVTRGAVYHHFGGKGEILRAIREHVSLPLLDEANTELLRRDGTASSASSPRSSPRSRTTRAPGRRSS